MENLPSGCLVTVGSLPSLEGRLRRSIGPVTVDDDVFNSRIVSPTKRGH
jgi:hypothetical protein